MIDIVSQIEPTQTALKRRRGQLVARYFRWAVALSLIAFVLVAPSQAIFDMYVAFIPIQLTLTETSTSWIVRGLSTFLGYLALSYIGIVLLSSRKRSVLYLRHFDMPAESHRISKSIEGGIGRHYRSRWTTRASVRLKCLDWSGFFLVPEFRSPL